LIGRLGSDPELRAVGSTKVCDFSLATGFKRRDGSEETTWHKIVVWGKAAEHCAKYLGKGRQVAVQGRLTVDKWEDRDGKKRTTVKVTAYNVTFLSGDPARQTKASAPPVDIDEDIPF
jgi:single-strand DNA-binding protein